MRVIAKEVVKLTHELIRCTNKQIFITFDIDLASDRILEYTFRYNL